MAFLDELSADVTKVTGDMAEIVKLNAAIAEQEQKIENCYREIGRIYYKNFAHRNEEIFRGQVESIRASEALILSEAKQVITKIKGLIVCPSCGSGQPLDSVFCSVCGTRLAESAKIPAAPVNEAPAVQEPVVETVPTAEEPAVEIPVEEKAEVEVPAAEKAPVTEESAAEESIQNAGDNVCIICGTPMSEDMLFCINCGTRRS